MSLISDQLEILLSVSVSGNESENFRYGRHTYFFLIIFFSGKNIFLCILKGISPFKLHKLIYSPEHK